MSAETEIHRMVQRPASDDSFRLLVESVRDYAIFLLAPDGTIASWNVGAERIKGYRPDEIIGRHFSIFYPPEAIAAGTPARALAAAAGDGSWTDEGWRLRKDGTRFLAHVTITALRDGAGRLVGYGKVTRDVTAQREATEALRLSEERLRLMTEAVRDYAIFMLDPTGHVASWNIGAERLKGWRADEIIGRHFSTFYTDEDRRREHPQEELARALTDGRYEEEGWRVRKDGTRFWANVVITTLFDAEGRHVGFTKVTRDFTEPRRLREAQLAIQLRDEFLSIAGHELRTPLSALLLQIESLTRIANGHDARLKQRLGKALASVRRLEKLINQVLDVTRITAGRLQLEPEPTSLDAVAREVADRFADAAAESRCELVLQLAPVEGTWDRSRLDQVMTNLVSNAIKYGRGAPVSIETRLDGGEAVLRVIDRGVGILPEDLDKVFERFERGHSARQYGGFGLGLWISRQIVEASAGRITVESEPGRGATFEVRLPLQPPLSATGAGPWREASNH